MPENGASGMCESSRKDARSLPAELMSPGLEWQREKGSCSPFAFAGKLCALCCAFQFNPRLCYIWLFSLFWVNVGAKIVGVLDQSMSANTITWNVQVASRTKRPFTISCWAPEALFCTKLHPHNLSGASGSQSTGISANISE